MVGAPLNLMIDNIMVSVAGMVIANFVLLMIAQVKGAN
jgi:hypothetical protein